MLKYNINDMKLYKTTNRFMKSYLELKNRLKRTPTVYDLADIDHLHYNGTKAVDFAIKKTKINKNSIVLDIGSGIGGPARYIAKKTDAKVYAVEIQKELNEVGKTLTKEQKLNKNIKHINKDIQKFISTKIKFNCILSWLALYHISDHKKLFGKIFSVLKSDGLFYSEDFFKIKDFDENEKNNLSKNFYANHLVTYENYLKELSDQNFIIIAHYNMSSAWEVFTKKRLKNYEKNSKANIKLHGLKTVRNIQSFYRLAHDLLAEKKIGGIRFLCKKK